MNLNQELLKEASKWIGTKEEPGKDNSGKQIQEFQKAVDGKAQGESWCMAFIQYCIKEIEKKYSIQCLVFKSEHCLTVLSKSQHKVVKDPQPGDLIIWRMGNTMNGHVGIINKILDNGRCETIEGNTSDSQSVDRNGDGIFLKNRSLKGTDQMRVAGFIRAF